MGQAVAFVDDVDAAKDDSSSSDEQFLLIRAEGAGPESEGKRPRRSLRSQPHACRCVYSICLRVKYCNDRRKIPTYFVRFH